jgi:hypothetical protein
LESQNLIVHEYTGAEKYKNGSELPPKDFIQTLIFLHVFIHSKYKKRPELDS